MGLQVPSQVALGEIRILQGDPKPLFQSRSTAAPRAVWGPLLWCQGKDRLNPVLPTGVFQLGFQSLYAWQDPTLSLGLSPTIAEFGIPKLAPSHRALRPLAWGVHCGAVAVAAAAGAVWVLEGQLVTGGHRGSGWAAGQGCMAQSRQGCRG